MAPLPDLTRSLIEALEEPALIVQDGKTLSANEHARLLLGQMIEGSDVRLALRHPDAVQLLLDGAPGYR